jgi:hypothetical protein
MTTALMPIHDPPVWTIDGISFNGDPDANGITWIADEDSDPLSAPAPTATFTPKYQRHGSFWLPGFVERGKASFTFQVSARRDDWAGLRRASLKMLALCQDQSRLYPLVFQSEIGNLVQYVTREGDILIKHVEAEVPAFMASVQFTAPDPRRYDETWTTLTTGVPQGSITGLDFSAGSGAGLDFDAGSGAGLDFGPAGTAGTIVLDNTRGTAPTAPTLTLAGPLTTPVLTVANGSIKYNATLAAGDYVVINPEDPSVLFGAAAASRGYLANPANWDAFTVPPGGSLSIGLSHSGPSTDLGTLTARFRAAYW